MEYDVDIKITKLVRGKGLCEDLFSSFETTKEVALVIKNEQPAEDENHNNWIQDMTTFLSRGGYP